MNPEAFGTLGSARSRLDRVDVVTLWYLGLPNLIFLIGWLKPAVGVVAAVLLIAALLHLSLAARDGQKPQRSALGFASWVVVPGIALVWVFVSGVGHFVFANEDWVVRDSVMRDLATLSWPVQYHGANASQIVLLRAPLGYYLPSAVLGQWFGAGVTDNAVFVWTVLGVILTFVLLTDGMKSAAQRACIIAVFVLFSGLDLLGWLIVNHLNNAPHVGDHLEWWATLFQYSSITTQLFWVPNHALPAWLVAVWLLRQMRFSRIAGGFGIALVALTPLWSPLAAIGLAPLVTVALARDFWRSLRASKRGLMEWLKSTLTPGMAVTALVFFILIAPYLTLASETVPGSWLAAHIAWLPLIERVALFVAIEFLIYWVLLWFRFRFDLLLTTSGIILLLLPWYRFGPFSDLTMRASIPALVIFAARLGQWFVERLFPAQGIVAKESMAASLAMLAFIVGMATPFQEIIRPFMLESRPQELGKTLYQMEGDEATHYVAPRQGKWVEQFLKSGDVTGSEPSVPTSANGAGRAK